MLVLLTAPSYRPVVLSGLHPTFEVYVPGLASTLSPTVFKQQYRPIVADETSRKLYNQYARSYFKQPTESQDGIILLLPTFLLSYFSS